MRYNAWKGSQSVDGGSDIFSVAFTEQGDSHTGSECVFHIDQPSRHALASAITSRHFMVFSS